MENGLSNSDVALLAGRNNDGVFGGDNGLVWLLVFQLLLQPEFTP